MDLDNINLQSVCRTCLTKTCNMSNIFNIADIIMSCASIQLEEDDGLPSTICSECTVLANKAYEFRLLCEHSDIILQKALHENNGATIKIEKCDLNSVEVHIDTDCSTYYTTDALQYSYQTNNSQLKADNINEVHKTDKVDENEVFEIKTEILDVEIDENKEFQAINNETLLLNHFSCNTTQFTYCQDNATNLETAINNVNKKKRYSSNKKKSKITNDKSIDEKVQAEFSTGFFCQYCDQKFSLEKSLQIHEQKHSERFKCDICGKSFQDMRKFQNHINVHKRKGAYPCPTCGKQFSWPENLIAHERIHTGIKPYSCRFCDKSFPQWSERRSHELVHTSEKAYLCSICGTNFARLSSLDSHTRRIHFNPSEERPHVCTVCNKKFKVRRNLSEHMFCHSDERNFVCKVCNKGFKHKKNLRLHEKIHTGVKPHVCPVCQRAFLQKHVLTSHLRTHTLQA